MHMVLISEVGIVRAHASPPVAWVGLKSLPVLRNWSDILKKIISGIASSLESFVFYKCISHAGGSPLSIQFLSKNILRKKNYLNSDIPFSNVVISAKGLGLLDPMLFTAKTRNW